MTLGKSGMDSPPQSTRWPRHCQGAEERARPEIAPLPQWVNSFCWVLPCSHRTGADNKTNSWQAAEKNTDNTNGSYRSSKNAECTQKIPKPTRKNCSCQCSCYCLHNTAQNSSYRSEITAAQMLSAGRREEDGRLATRSLFKSTSKISVRFTGDVTALALTVS